MIELSDSRGTERPQDELQQPQQQLQTLTEETQQQQQKHRSKRRAYIDVIRVSLTWAILLYHVAFVYSPFPNYINDPYTEYQGWLFAVIFVMFMTAWNMPMFFFLSGVSVFFAMKRRDERAFRLERFHRLLVPALVIAAVTQFPTTLVYFSMLSTPCEEISFGDDTNATCNLFYVPMANESFGYFVAKRWGDPPRTPDPMQGWFLVYLFVFSQILASPFYLWHPSSAALERTCGCCCGGSHRRFLCCLGLRTPTPKAFADAAWRFLGSGVKLALVPGAVLALVEIPLRPFFPDGQYNFVSVATDVANDLNYGFVYFLGFVVAAIDERLEPILKTFAWLYISIGTILCLIYGVLIAFLDGLVPKESTPRLLIDFLVVGSLKGFGEWLIVLGIVAVCRRYITTYRRCLSTLSTAAMPFYLIHHQVIVAVGVVILQFPVFNAFPFLFSISSFVTTLLAYLITKSGPFGYFFGLKTAPGACLPGEMLHGLLPAIVLAAALIIETSLAAFYLRAGS